MKRLLVIGLFSPAVLAGLMFGFCVYGFQLGLEMVHSMMSRVADWVDR
jgi:hypothetical protein